MTSLWPLIHAERRGLAGDLSSLDAAQWSTPSLCPGWTVQDVLAHMVATAKMTPPKFFGGLVASGFRFHSMSATRLAAERGSSGAETLSRFEAALDATSHPPGPLMAMLGEQVVHGTDIRRPLGLAHEYPADVLAQVADFYRRSNLLIGGKKRVAGLRLQATDTGWSAGAGPEVKGPMLSLVVAMCGRRAALDDLSGEGAGALAARM